MSDIEQDSNNSLKNSGYTGENLKTPTPEHTIKLTDDEALYLISRLIELPHHPVKTSITAKLNEIVDPEAV